MKALRLSVRQQERWLDLLFLSVLLVLSPFFLLPKITFTWVFLFIPLLWIGRWAKTNGFLERTPFDWPLGLFLLQTATTLFIVPDVESALPKITAIVFGVLLFYGLVAILKSPPWIKLGILGFLFGGAVVAFLGFLDMLRTSEAVLAATPIPRLLAAIPKKSLHLPGAELGINPNAVGGALTLFLPAGTFLLAASLKRDGWAGSLRLRIIIFTLMLLLVLPVVAMIILAQSFSVWLALLLSLFFFGLLGLKKLGRGSLIIIGAEILIFLALGLGVAVGKIDLWKNELHHKLTVRFSLWQSGLETIEKKPLTGIGLNQVRRLPGPTQPVSHFHNQLIQTGAEQGIPAVIAYLSFLLISGVLTRRIWKKGRTPWQREAAMGIEAGQMAFFIFGLFDAIPLGTKPSIFFWYSLALLAALDNLSRRKPEVQV